MTAEHGAVHVASIQLFCKAAELGGFSAAAEVLGITPAAVSRSVARIEQRLGVQLFVRSTRQVRLTDAGRLYFEQCNQALQQLADAERAVQDSQSEPSGLLRISMPTTYGHFRVMPLLTEFRQKHPKIRFEIDVSNRNIDLIEDGHDLAIRLGTPRDSRLVARKLEDATLGVYAARPYLKRRGTPRALTDLQKHDCIQFVLPSTGKAMPWVFAEKGREVECTFDTPLRFMGDVLACVYCAATGGGLFQTYDFVVAGMQLGSDMVEVLKPLRGRTRQFSILYPRTRYQQSSTKAFVEFLLEKTRALSKV